MAAAIELKKINDFTRQLPECENTSGAVVYGVDVYGNSVKINTEKFQENLGIKGETITTINSDLAGLKLRVKTLEDEEQSDIDVDSELSGTSENPVQNKVVKAELDNIKQQINQKPDKDTTYTAGNGISINELNEVSVKVDGDTVQIDEQGRLKAAPPVTVDSELSETSENPVQNKVIKAELNAIKRRFIPQISDLDEYEGEIGDIVLYVNNDTDTYEFYKFVGGEDKIIPANTKYIVLSDDWGENAPKGYYTFENWRNRNSCYYIASAYRKRNDEYSNMTTEDGVVLGQNALNRISFGFGCPLNQVITYGNADDGWLVSPVAVGDLAWDEEENIYKITAVQIVSGTLNLTLKIWRTAYKGKVKIGSNDNFVDIREALGTEFVVSYSIRITTYQPTYRLTNIDNSDIVLYLFYKHYYATKQDVNTEFYKSVFPIPMNSAHYHFEPLLGDITEGGFIQQTDSEPFVIPSEKWQRINVQSTTQGVSGDLTMLLDIDTSTLILRDGNKTLSAIDFSVFTKDGMLSDVDLYNVAEDNIDTEIPYLKFKFNTESGVKPIRVSLSSLNISLAVDRELSTTSHNPIENKTVTLALQSKASQTELDAVKQDVEDLKNGGSGSGSGGGEITVDSELSTSSTNPVQNKVIATALNSKVDSNSLKTVATSGSYNDLTDKPTIPAATTVDSTIIQNGTNPVQGGAIYTALSGKVGNGGGCNTIIVLSQTEYDNLGTKDENTWYAIPETTA